MTNKPILCLDFDGVCHQYVSPWINAWTIPDPPVAGLFPFLEEATKQFRVAIYSTRSEFERGREGMQRWFEKELLAYYDGNTAAAATVLLKLEFPDSKPPALVTLDDRAITFKGDWPDLGMLRGFIPWNAHLKIKKPKPERESVALPPETGK
jgi:hypothetical protein